MLFKNGTSIDGDNFYPEVIILRNDTDKTNFERMAEIFNWRENIEPIGEIAEYPFYILTMDYLACGIRYGDWRYFDSIEELSRIVEIDDIV